DPAVRGALGRPLGGDLAGHGLLPGGGVLGFGGACGPARPAGMRPGVAGTAVRAGVLVRCLGTGGDV
ncbi:hypothetical protein, partial [Streptomyces sp. st140]|uniref:hypothetical protein n=1 Tax=Streptomyces sp. st140 TaxID=1828052 RepID=UPI001C54CBC7